MLGLGLAPSAPPPAAAPTTTPATSPPATIAPAAGAPPMAPANFPSHAPSRLMQCPPTRRDPPRAAEVRRAGYARPHAAASRAPSSAGAPEGPDLADRGGVDRAAREGTRRCRIRGRDLDADDGRAGRVGDVDPLRRLGVWERESHRRTAVHGHDDVLRPFRRDERVVAQLEAVV